MTFEDLKEMVGQTIDYYEVRGKTVKSKKGKIGSSPSHGVLNLKLVDKLGREYSYHSIYYRQGFNYEITTYDLGYCILFLDKNEAYNYVIEKLRKERQEINKKMLRVQMELYGKKIDINNEK